MRLKWVSLEELRKLWDTPPRDEDTSPRAEDLQCPVCGYYCLGHGGVGCIDKPKLVKAGKDIK